MLSLISKLCAFNQIGRNCCHYENLPMHNIQRFFKVVNNENFQKKFFVNFLIFAQNIDCEYPQSMFWSKNKNQRTNGPVNAHLSLLQIPKNMFEYYGI